MLGYSLRPAILSVIEWQQSILEAAAGDKDHAEAEVCLCNGGISIDRLCEFVGRTIKVMLAHINRTLDVVSYGTVGGLVKDPGDFLLRLVKLLIDEEFASARDATHCFV